MKKLSINETELNKSQRYAELMKMSAAIANEQVRVSNDDYYCYYYYL